MPNERVRGFLQLAATNAVSKICWALTLILLLRHLGQAQFGVLATLWSIAIIAGGFVDLGTTQALVREGARTPGQARHLALQSLQLQVALSLVTTALLAVAAQHVVPTNLGNATTRWLVVALGVLTPLIDRLQNLFTAYSQISGRYHIFSVTRSTYFVLLLAALIVVVLAHGDIVAVSAVYFVITAAFVLLSGFGTWHGMPATDTSPASALWHLVSHGLPFLGVMVLTLAYGRIEVSVLGAWGLAAAAGAYHIVYQTIQAVYSVCGIYFTVVYPRLYRHMGDPAAMREDFRDTVRSLSVLAWAAMPPLLLFPAPILHLLGGADLETYAPLLRVLALLILLTPLSAALNFLLPMDRMKTRIACDAIGIAITLIGSIFGAITDRPIIVAAFAVVGYAAAICIAHLVLTRKLAGITAAALSELAMTGARALPAALLVIWLPLPWWLACATYLLCFAVFLMLTGHTTLQQLCHRSPAIRS